jgi:hypothetical protein
MPSTDSLGPVRLAESLLSPAAYYRTGLVLVARELLGRESDLAASVGADSLDWVAWKLERLDPHCRFAAMSHQSLIEDVSLIASEATPGSCVLAFNGDVLLSGMPAQERTRFWGFLRTVLRPRNPVILALPAGAGNLLPQKEAAAWVSAGRLAEWGKVEDD